MGVANYISMTDGRITLFPVTERRLFSWTKNRKVKSLVAALKNEQLNVELRTMAAIGLGRVKARSAAFALGSVMVGKGSAHLRRQCAAALGRIVAPEAYESLVQAVHDEELIVRRPAISALGPLIDDRNAAVLLPFLQDADPRIRESAMIAVGRSSLTGKVDVLIAGLDDPDSVVRAAAANWLGVLHDPRSIPALLDRFEVDGKKNHRALVAIGKFSPAELGERYETYRRLLNREAATLRRMGF